MKTNGTSASNPSVVDLMHRSGYTIDPNDPCVAHNRREEKLAKYYNQRPDLEEWLDIIKVCIAGWWAKTRGNK